MNQCGRVRNAELYAQRLQKLIYRLFCEAFSSITIINLVLDHWTWSVRYKNELEILSSNPSHVGV